MVGTSARNAGGPWFDSRSRNDRFLYANYIVNQKFFRIDFYCIHISHRYFRIANGQLCVFGVVQRTGVSLLS